MPFSLKRKRPGYAGPMVLRPRFGRRFTPRSPYKTFRRSFRKGKPKGRGYVRKYNQKAFRGRPKLTARKLAKCMETKMYEVGVIRGAGLDQNAAVTTTYTTPAVTSDRIFYWAPMQHMVQGTGSRGFNGECIWLKGISFETTVVPDVNDLYKVRFMVWKVRARPQLQNDFGGSVFQLAGEGSVASGGVGINSKHFRFLDHDYSATAPEYHFMPIETRKNQECPSTCLFDRTYNVGHSQTDGASAFPFKHVRIWIPLNQLYRWTSQENEDLTVSPNYGQFGDYYFTMSWCAGRTYAANATTSSLRLTGSVMRVYYRDP
jgi:hypothetical protein